MIYGDATIYAAFSREVKTFLHNQKSLRRRRSACDYDEFMMLTTVRFEKNLDDVL